MNQREGNFRSVVSEWRGINQRVNPNLVLDDQCIASMGVVVDSTALLSRHEGKRLIESFPTRVTTVSEVGEIVIIQTKDTVYSILKADFLQSLQSYTEDDQTFTYVSGGDTNGVFYFLGTKKGVQAWENPATTAQLAVSGDTDDTGTKDRLTNRTNDEWKSVTKVAPYVIFDLGLGHSLTLSTLTIKSSSSPSENIRHFSIEGSNDGVTWIGLYQYANLSWTSNQWQTFAINANESYRYFRLIHSVAGLNYPLTAIKLKAFAVDDIESYTAGVATIDTTSYSDLNASWSTMSEVTL